MKKIFFYVISVFLVVFVSSCEDDNNMSNDLIIGQWQYETQFENDVEIIGNDCNPSTIAFFANGNKNTKYYDLDFSGNCIVVEEINSTWKNKGNDLYEDNFEGDIFLQKVTFENNNNRVIFEDSDTDGNGDVVVYKFVYKRIN